MNQLIHGTEETSRAQQSLSSFLYPADTLGQEKIPNAFLEFCRASIEASRSKVVCSQPVFDAQNGTGFDGAEYEFLDLESNDQLVIPLEPAPSTSPVVAVDTSTIKLGEFVDGHLCALRGAIVILQEGQYRYLRYGPLVFSAGGKMPGDGFSQLGLPPFSGEFNVDILLKRVRNVLERWLQLSASTAIRNGFVLVDGSLTAGTPDNPSKDLERILGQSRRSGNVVIAISKKTRLRIQDQPLSELMGADQGPSLIDVDEQLREQFPPYPVRFLGRVFVGKLAKHGYPFRIDVDRQIRVEEAVRSIERMVGRDIVDQGYPETLRLAHILATFTASDVLAAQTFAAAQFGIQLIPRFALRRSLFGPFGTVSEGWH